MSDRLTEIRERLDALTSRPPVRRGPFTLNIIATQLRSGKQGDRDLIAHAPDDLAWLLAALESERRHSATLVERLDRYLLENARLLCRLDFETRLVAELEAELDHVHRRHAEDVERLLAEVERLRTPAEPEVGRHIASRTVQP